MLRKRVLISREATVFFLCALFVFAIIRMFAYFEKSLRPTILSVTAARANIIATEAINNAVTEKVAQGIQYQDLIVLQKNTSGDIVLAQINTAVVNGLMAETTMRVQETLAALGGEKIYIPLGQVMGSYLLANLGPRIPITLLPVGYVNTSIDNTFEEAGINQVRHKIYFNIHADVQVVVPFVSSVTKVSTAVPIVDALYPGKVPDTVINLQFPASRNLFDPQLPSQ